MGGSSPSKPVRPQSVVNHPNEYRTQQENLQLTHNDWTQILRDGGVNAVMRKKMELDGQWKKQPVVIALIGQTGSGKSTLIRRFLGLQPDDPDEPKIGSSVIECTKKAREYPKPGTGLVYIDLPGVGSTTFTCAFRTPQDQERYSTLYRLRTIDYFLLVSQNKFNDQEKFLAEYITQKLKKKFIFVQTKMDNLRNEFGNKLLEKREGFEAVKIKIRTDIRKQLGVNDTKRIFLVSNDVRESERDDQQLNEYDQSLEYEFDSLVQQIQDDMLGEDGLTAEKGRAFILATVAISKSAIQAKANTLRKQSWGWSTLSAVIGATPIPGPSTICDAAIAVTQATNYFDAFGLNPIHYLGEGTAVEKITNLTKAMSASTGTHAAAVVKRAIALHVVEESIKIVPIVGMIVGPVLGAGVSFTSTCTILHQLIDFCEHEALKVLQRN